MDLEALDPLCERASKLTSQLPDGEQKKRCEEMIVTLLENPLWPDLKIGGWLEHITTVCIHHDITSINTEREFTRPIKHAYYRRMGYNLPKTIDVMIQSETGTPGNKAIFSTDDLRLEKSMLEGLCSTYARIQLLIERGDSSYNTQAQITRNDAISRQQRLSKDNILFPNGVPQISTDDSPHSVLTSMENLIDAINLKIPQ